MYILTLYRTVVTHYTLYISWYVYTYTDVWGTGHDMYIGTHMSIHILTHIYNCIYVTYMQYMMYSTPAICICRTQTYIWQYDLYTEWSVCRYNIYTDM